MKAYFEKNYNGEPYDALGRRKNQELFYIMGGGKIAPNAKKGAVVTGPSAATSSGVSRPSAKSTATAASSVRTISSVGGGSAQAKALEG